MSTPFAAFGPGILIASRTDITIPAPVNVGFAQEFSLEMAATVKQLYGQKQFPLAAARGTIKATGKFKSAVISGLAWNALMYGETSFSTGTINWNIDSTFTIPAVSSYIVTVGSSLTFEADLGVRYSTSGLPFQRVSTGAEAAGKYSIVNTNTYTFAAADLSAKISVTYTNNSGTGQSLIVTNKMIGTTPTFQLDYYTNFNQPGSKPFVVRVFECVASKHGMGFKLEDFMIPEFEFDLFANPADQIYEMCFPEIS